MACAPTVDRHTTFGGLAAASAERSEAISARASGKPGDGSKIGGNMANTPSTPLKAGGQACRVMEIGTRHLAAAHRPRKSSIRIAKHGADAPLVGEACATAPPT